MNLQEAKNLLDKYQENASAPAERRLVNDWLDLLEQTGVWEFSQQQKKKLQIEIEEHLLQQITPIADIQSYTIPIAPTTIRTLVFRYKWWITAAAVLLLFVVSPKYYTIQSEHEAIALQPSFLPKDVEAPTTTKAVILLPGGNRIAIDSIGSYTQVGGATVQKIAPRELAYSTFPVIGVQQECHTLANPVCSEVVSLIFSDGSKVSLNAGSSVTYPTAFIGNSRRVVVTGEAYFNVTHNSEKPFYVCKGDVQVKVLGTAFNVNAYDDEDDLKVTLVQGKIQLRKGQQTHLLKPGQQANVRNNIQVIDHADLYQVLAWKNGEFYFENADIKKIMKELSRWYGVSVKYVGNISSEKFTGIMSRKDNITNVLKLMKLTGLKFKIEEKVITVYE